jgi:hypothetical protein
MLLIHDTYNLWIATAVAAHELQCGQYIAEIARARAWQRHRRSGPSACVWCELICDEIQLILAGSDEPPTSGRL